MSAQRRAATRRHSGSSRGNRQRSRAARTNDGAAPRPAAQERPFDTELAAREPAKPGPSRAEHIGRAGRRLVSLERTEGLRRFVRETRAEMSKISWPDQETTRNLTLVVIAVSTVLGVLLGGIDYVLFRLFEALS